MPHAETPGLLAAPRNRLRWWTELPLILLVYACYSAGRLLARGDVTSAVDHGLAILRVEKLLFLNAENPLNRLFTREPWLGVPADFWYASLHYLVTPVILVWVFRSRAVHYRVARTWLMTSTFIGLIGFTLLPTCPPRLLSPTYGFVDTMAYYSSYGWWGGDASAPKGLGGLTNQYAAMPSLHCGWALWCGVMLWRYGGNRLTKIAAVVYPTVTVIVVMGTANHYFLDAVAGVAVMGAGLLLTPYVLRCADRVRARFEGRGSLVAASSARASSEATGTASSAASPAAEASIVSGGCQTSAGERFPRQRESRFEPGAEPGASPTDAGDGAPATAR
ncbi:integral membrane protein [Streptomyces davaonensis JCM 4913]|uniref:Integral membrane protein n=1 Tax=Streptomyces davaonensis (strain DSM 101723 / JCM 4913 / KCC S-0913 / 768) TaxID=1214101 RepID=K4R942_STRDJ|nr:phosphatase PAP2 family protein [Streptomyces davaonensis]CCK29838.1 integral membrane protein [Streptomyces davaonensis JCM 4913]